MERHNIKQQSKQQDKQQNKQKDRQQTSGELQNARIWQRQEIHLGLENMTQLLKRLGNPQEKLAVIHVAGTNGKGSQIAMMKAILMEAGYHVGVYTSPAVFSKLEIIQLDHQQITKQEYSEYQKEIDDIARLQEIETKEMPSPFEKETALAFLYFYRNQCDVVLLETGMGGDLDATNVVKHPICSVITGISMDHMAFLGSTLSDIAHKKAGIIKEKCPVSIGFQEPEAEQILIEQAEQKQAACVVAKRERLGRLDREENGFRLDYKTSNGCEYCQLYLPFQSTYQVENAVNVLETIELLKPVLKNITSQTVAEGLRKARWAGRFELLSRSPDFYIDGAHNPAAAVQLKETISQLRNIRIQQLGGKPKVVYIVGMLKDKEWKKVLDIMLRQESKEDKEEEQVWIPVTIPHNRGLDGACLGDYIRHKGKKAEVYIAKDIKSGVKLALEHADGQDFIVAFGSLSFLDVIKRELKQQKYT